MFDFISRMFAKEEQVRSKDLARERLRLVLVHDRASISPQILDDLKFDLIKVISKYIEIDENGIRVNLDSSDSSVALVASIPVRRIRRGT